MRNVERLSGDMEKIAITVGRLSDDIETADVTVGRSADITEKLAARVDRHDDELRQLDDTVMPLFDEDERRDRVLCDVWETFHASVF